MQDVYVLYLCQFCIIFVLYWSRKLIRALVGRHALRTLSTSQILLLLKTILASRLLGLLKVPSNTNTNTFAPPKYFCSSPSFCQDSDGVITGDCIPGNEVFV